MTLNVVTAFASASLPRTFMPGLPLVVLALAASFALALALALALAVALAPFLRPRFGALAVAPTGLGGGFIAPAFTRASKSFRPLTDFAFEFRWNSALQTVGIVMSFAHDIVEPTQLLVMHSA